MVDPDRKINHLTEEDIDFLEECKEEFANRFTIDEESFAEHLKIPLAKPPIQDWNFVDRNGHQDNRDGRKYHNNNHRHRRGNNQRRGYHPYRHQGDREQNNRYQHSSRYVAQNGGDNYRRRDRDESRDYKPIEIRRDYSNFVAASKRD